MSDKLELEKRCENMVGVSRITQSVQGMSKNDFRTSLEILNFHDFLKFFFHPESQIHIRLGDLKGGRKTRFEVLRSSQSAQGMCRNDPRTSLEKVIFCYFLKFSSFLALGLRSGPYSGIFEILKAPRQEYTTI